jgi:hypothetical protein
LFRLRTLATFSTDAAAHLWHQVSLKCNLAGIDLLVEVVGPVRVGVVVVVVGRSGGLAAVHKAAVQMVSRWATVKQQPTNRLLPPHDGLLN